MENDGLTKYRVKTIVSRIPATLDGAWNQLPTAEIRLLGEFLHCRRAGAINELTLLDTNDPTFSITATLPATISLPRQGRVLGIAGRLSLKAEGRGSAAKLKVFFDGNSLDGKDMEGRLYRERREVFEQFALAVEEYRDVDLAQVKTVALVTGVGVVAKDFTDNLNPPKKPPIDVKLLTARLWDAADIGAKIRAAATDPDVDVIVIARGGGSPEDFHPFSMPEVVEAVATAVRSKYVITALGHAANETKCDQLAHHFTNVPADAGAYLRKREAEIFFARRGRKPEVPASEPPTPVPAQTNDLAVPPSSAYVRRSEKNPSVVYQYLPSPLLPSRRQPRSVPSYVPTPLTLRQWLHSFWRYQLRPFIARWTKRAILVGIGFSVGWKGKELDRPVAEAVTSSTPVKSTAVERAKVPMLPTRTERSDNSMKAEKAKRTAVRRRTAVSVPDDSKGGPTNE